MLMEKPSAMFARIFYQMTLDKSVFEKKYLLKEYKNKLLMDNTMR